MENLNKLYPCGRIARRRFLFQTAAGFLGTALSSLWADNGGLLQEAHLPGSAPAKSVIFLFMCGGVSHIDTFDPKDNKHAGKIMDAIGFGDNNAPMKRPVIPILRTFKQYGKSGFPFPIGFRTWETPSTISRWFAPCTAIRRTTFPRCSKAQLESLCGSSNTLAWAVGFPMPWVQRTRIFPRL
jgi:hypothetical protein